MSTPPFRVVVPFCDQWADPGPDGACRDACLQALATPPERLDALQRPISHVARYIGEVDQGGHARYFQNLDPSAMGIAQGAIEGLYGLALFHAADILTRAHARWTGLAHTAGAGLVPAGTFADLDDEYTILGMADPADHPQTMLDHFLRDHADLFIELAAPTAADEPLIATGDPRMHADGGRKAWLSVATHDSPRVRLKAAQNLLGSDRETALRIARAVRADPRTSPWVLSKVLTLLRKAGVPIDRD